MAYPGVNSNRNPWHGRIIAIRISKGYASANQAALAIGMNPLNYQAIEKGRNISTMALGQLLKSFGASLLEFATIKPVVHPTETKHAKKKTKRPAPIVKGAAKKALIKRPTQ